MSNYIDRIIYDAGGGNTGNIYYMRIVRRGDIKVWNPNTEELVAASDIAWADSYTMLIEQGPVGEKTGVYAIAIEHDWSTRDDIAKADYGTSYADLPDVTRETISQEMYGKSLNKLTVAGSSNVEDAWEERNAYRIAVNAKYDLIKNIPSGTYDIIVYKQLGSEPANTDDVEKQFETKLGDIFGF